MKEKEFYLQRVSFLENELKTFKQKKSVFGMLRLGSLLVLIVALYILWSINIWLLLGVVLIIIAVFIFLIHKDVDNRENIIRTQDLLNINNNELLALEGQYSHFESGDGFQPKDHYYANDMDLFGQASVFQFLNRTSSQMGSSELASWLLKPAPLSQILQRQQAIIELKDKNIWRQQFQQILQVTEIKNDTRIRLNNWALAATAFIQYKPWAWLRYLLPAAMLLITGLTIFSILPISYFYGGLLIMAIISYQLNKIIGPIHNQLGKMVDELEALSGGIKCIEKETFTTELMLLLQKKLSQKEGLASAKISYLKKILERLDLRYNIVISFPLNVFLLWNLQQTLALENWKQQQQHQIDKWFEVLKIVEALQSLATLHYNQPSWTFPIFKEKHFSIVASQLGHPLIKTKNRVSNFININNAGEIMLVTGSNMAGKSTYLRSVGVNVILAMAGAPVCADKFELSPVQLMSSMRIADNLEESTSTFYAELKKLQIIIEKVNADEKVFILLDEILRGTNSHDRHTGSEALIKQLIKKNAAAILATHDLELAKLKDQFPRQILNYHFDVQVSNDELYFDYALKPGVCTSMNASILMKKVGIEI